MTDSRGHAPQAYPGGGRRRPSAVGATLPETPEWLQAIWDAAGDAMTVSDADGFVLLANPAYYRLYGLTPAEVLGRSFAVIFPEGRRAWAEEEYRATFARPEIAPAVEATIRRADGAEHVVESRYTFIERDGQRVAMLSIVRDVTERARLQAALREHAETLDTLAAVGQSLTSPLDLEALVQGITEAATGLTGARYGAFFYNIADELVESFAGFPMPRNTALFGPTFRGEGPIRLGDVARDPRYGRNPPYRGMPDDNLSVRSYLAAPVVTRSGEVLGGLFLGHPDPDVFTAREERRVAGLAAEAALAIDNARLYRQAQEAIRARERFLSTAAHELRTPLTALKGFGQLLARHLEQPAWDRERVVGYAGHLQAQAARLETLVNDLLDLSRLRQDQLALRREPMDLVALVRDVVALFEQMPERTARHTLVAEVPERLVAAVDPSRFEQVVGNLVSNALKYSPDGGEVRVTLRASDGRAELAVSDQGIGIPPEEQRRLFEPFERVESGSATTSGVGLGLYITEQIVRRHGGTVALRSEPGRGSTFLVRLPLLRGSE